MSTKDLAGFQADLQNFADKVMPAAHANACKVIALDLLERIILPTPVDTGLAKGNWQVTTSTPASGILDVPDKEGAAALAKGAEVIQSAQPMQEIIWISNNLPYIGPLEDGHSQQAPRGWVAIALEEIKAKYGGI